MSDTHSVAVCLQCGEGRKAVTLHARWSGPDLVVVIGGGTHPHVGAVAVAQPRPSLRGDGSQSATASVIALLGHKEDELARWAALRIASHLGCSVVVSAGVHVDQGSLEEVTGLDRDARQLVEDWLST